MTQDITPIEAIKRLEQHFGSHEGMLTHTLTMLSTYGQPADVFPAAMGIDRPWKLRAGLVDVVA